MTDDLEDLCHEELAHIDGPVTRKLKQQAQRIEQLEAALRWYAEYTPTYSPQDFRSIARAALDAK